MTRGFAIALNALGLYGMALVLATAFAAQLLLSELPCPLCLMQRIQFAMLAAGPILNVRFGPRPSHYALALLATVAGAVFAARAKSCCTLRPGMRATVPRSNRLSLLYLGLYRFCRCDRSHRNRAIV